MPTFRPKLIALDLDGTLLTSAGQVTPRAERAISTLKAGEVRIVLCTGRPPRYVRQLAEDLKLADLVIVYNGAAVLDFIKEETSYRHELPRDLALEAITTLRRRHPAVMTGLETSHGWYLDTALFDLRRAALEARGLAPPDGCGDVCDFVRERVVKLLFRHPSLKASELACALETLPVYTTWTSERMLEVMAPQVNKGEALRYLCERFGLRAKEVAAFGDAHNDLEMLALAGIGVAVGNAAPEVKAVADLITGTNDEDGVAAVLEGWLEA